jgi:beta-lactamase class A
MPNNEGKMPVMPAQRSRVPVVVVALGLAVVAGLFVCWVLLAQCDRKPLLAAPDTFDAQTVLDREFAASTVPAQNEALGENSGLGDADDASQGDAGVAEGAGGAGSARNAGENPFAESDFTACANQTYYSILYFDEDTLYTSGNSSRTPSASVIKVFIMEYAFHLMGTGAFAPDSAVGGSTLSALVETMIQDSNNEATNALIDAFGMEEINGFLAESGYSDTVLQRHMLDNVARSAGLENFTSLDDCMRVLEKLYANRETYPYSEMLAIMEGQNVRTKIPLSLPADVSVANKTGELDDVENDIGIVFAADEGSDYAIVALTYGPFSSSGARSAIAQLARSAYDSRFAASPTQESDAQ